MFLLFLLNLDGFVRLRPVRPRGFVVVVVIAKLILGVEWFIRLPSVRPRLCAVVFIAKLIVGLAGKPQETPKSLGNQQEACLNC